MGLSLAGTPMNRSMLLLIALACCLCGCQMDHADNGASIAEIDIRRTLDDLAKQHCQALLKKDFATLDRLWADDFTFINPRGQLVTKAQRLENLRTGSTAFQAIEPAQLGAGLIAPDAGVTTVRVMIQGQYGNEDD